MKVLVATRETQGHRFNDFNFVPEGEFVIFTSTCDRDAGDPDGFCGCARSFSGVDTRRGTTTAKVVDMDITEDYYYDAIWDAFAARGWLIDEEDEADADAMAAWLLHLAESFPVGTVVERRLYDVQARTA